MSTETALLLLQSDYSDPRDSAWYWVISIAIHCLFAWRCFAIAENKGYNGALAALVGFFTGLIGLLIYYSLKPAAGAAVGSDPLQSGVYRGAGKTSPPPATSCWSCGSAVSGNATHCASCGSRLKY